MLSQHKEIVLTILLGENFEFKIGIKKIKETKNNSDILK
jgi:hypothetical protein